MSPIRVFASFDLDRDEDLLRKLIDVAKRPGVNFRVCDRSMRDARTEEHADRLCERLSNVDAVVVLCGEWTHRATNVNMELKMAQELGKRYYLVKGRRFRDCARPVGAHIDDKMYLWTPGALEELVLRFR